MQHPAFAEAGQAPGLEVWTIDKFEPVPLEPRLYGKFYNGDSYIVLKTTGDNTSSLSYDAHFWLGSKTTQDKKGTAALMTITLDDQLGGRAVHHREVQGYETSQFLGYFQPAIRYFEGGNESGFNQVETNAGAEKRLLKLSGCDNMRIEEVPADSSSLTSDHCFVLELDHDIFVLIPEGSRATQRRKIISVANTLRQEEHNGRATIEIIDEFSSDEDFDLFFSALGSGSRDDLIDDDSSLTYIRESVSVVYLYKVLVGDEIDLVAVNKPFRQRQLTSEDVFILDTPCSGIYIWLGKDVETDVRRNYNNIAQQYLDVKGYPSWVHVTRVSEGVESGVFQQYFHNWDSVNPVTVKSVKAIAAQIDSGLFEESEDIEAFTKFVGKSASATSYMPGEGAEDAIIFRAGSPPDSVAESPTLYTDEVYVVRYGYQDERGEDATVVYLWIGKDSDEESKKIALDQIAEVETELAGDLTVVKIPQGKETKHFLTLFKGNLVILCEGESENNKKSVDEGGIRLFKVEGTKIGQDVRATQVEETSDSLTDDVVFYLDTASIVYLWKGKESSDTEYEAAKNFLTTLGGDEKQLIDVNQGEEPEEFWELLGGAPEEKETCSGWKVNASRRVTTPLTLTAATVKKSGKIKLEELPPGFGQRELSDDGVYILDGGEELYVWSGKNIPERVKAARVQIIAQYIQDDGLERTVDSAIVVSLKQGKEPAIFKKMFPTWDDDMWDGQESYEEMKSATKAENSK